MKLATNGCLAVALTLSIVGLGAAFEPAALGQGESHARRVRQALSAIAASCFVDDRPGHAVVDVDVGPSGRVERATVIDDSSGQRAGACLAAAAVGAPVPPAPGRRAVTVRLFVVAERAEGW